MKKAAFGLLLVLAVIISLIGNPGTRNVQAAGLSGWANQIKLTLDHTKISSSVSDFPVLIKLSTSSGINSTDLSSIFSVLGNNSKKIAVTTADGVTQCNVEITRWDSSGKQAYLWVKVPSVSSTTDTVLYLYYDASHADNTAYVGETGSSPAQAVWTNGYVAVYHLTQTGSGRAGEYIDSTSKQHNGQGGSGLGYGTPALTTSNTITGSAQSFDGNDYINVPDSNDFSISTTGQLTISFWLSPAVQNMSSSEYIHYLSKGGPGVHEWAFRLYNANAARPQSVSLYVWNPSGGLGAGARWDHSNIPNNNWVFITGYFAPRTTHGNVEIYANGVNGTSNSDTTYSGYSITPANTSSPLRLGTRLDTGFLNGRLGEVRLSNVARSDAWIKADYYSEYDKLISFSAASTPPPTTPPAVTTNAAGSISTSGATLNGNLTAVGSTSSVAVNFEYGTTNAYGYNTPVQSRTSTGAFTANLTGLAANTTYYFRAKAVGASTVYGSGLTFTTASSPTPTPTPVAGTFGLNSGNNTYAQPANGLQAMRFQNTAGTGTLTKLELFVNDTTPAGKVRLGVFADNNGRPGTRILDAGEATVTNGWASISNLNLPATRNTHYWLAYNLQNVNSVRYQSGRPASSHYWANSVAYGALPGSFPSSGTGVGSNSNEYIMRATVNLSR